MADVTGTIHRAHDGKQYTLRLTMGGVAALQGRHGLDLGGLLTEGASAQNLPMSLLLDVVGEALRKGSKLPEDEIAEISDELLTADLSLVGSILQAAFPDAEAGNGKAPAKRKR